MANHHGDRLLDKPVPDPTEKCDRIFLGYSIDEQSKSQLTDDLTPVEILLIISGFSYKSRGAFKGDWEALPVGDRHQTLEKESVSSL
nr:hypothetical protein [Cylindrospermopsis raciborskii]